MFYFTSGPRKLWYVQFGLPALIAFHRSIDGTKDRRGVGLGRLVNHSRLKANVIVSRVFDDINQPRLMFRSARRIEAGEELLFDYGDRDKESVQANPWLDE